MATSEKARGEGMFVTVVCQRCSTPIRLHNTLRSQELVKVATSLSKKTDRQVKQYQTFTFAFIFSSIVLAG